MPRKPRSLKQELDRLSGELRDQGLTWTQIAEQFQERWKLNSRQAHREAHRYTQPKVVDIWNSYWPDEPLTVRKLGAWEAWPSPTGNEPPTASLNHLARIYQCHTRDLVDGEDHRDADEHQTRSGSAGAGRPAAPAVRAGGTQISGIKAMLSSMQGNPTVAALPAGQLRDTEFEQLVQALAVWALKMKRRDVLALIGAAATAAYASPLLDRLDDELERIALVAAQPSRVDRET